jgi:predicted kinase
MVIIVFGLPGSGKSYFASRLANRLNIRRINSDSIRRLLFVESNYSDQEKKAVYDYIHREMQSSIDQNMDVILDATFYKELLRTPFVEGCHQAGQRIIFIEVVSDQNIIKDRLSKPRADSEADYEVYKKLKEEYEPLTDSHLTLYSGVDNIDDMLDKATGYINEHASG